MDFIKKYTIWKSINEAKSVAKGDRSGGEREKVVIKSLDANSFEYKIINAKLMPGTEVINSAGLISSPEIADVLINNVNNETEITNVIGKLDSEFFKNNILIYEVKKDKNGLFGRDVQVIVFTKTARPQGIGANVKVMAVGQAETSNVDKSVIAGLEKVSNSASTPSSSSSTASSTKKELPAELAKKFPQVIKGATGKTILPSGKIILTSLVDIFKNSEKVSSTSLYNDFAKEVAGLENSTGALGDATDTMIKALKAGYGLKDTDNGDLTAALATSILIPEKATKPAEVAGPDQDKASAYESHFFGIDGKVHTRLVEETTDLLSQAAAAEVAASDAGGGIKGFDFQAYMTIASKYSGMGSSFGEVDLNSIEFPLDPAKISPATVNDGVKKVQQALINKFDKTAMKDVPQYKAFKKYGADGKFGNGTKNLIKFIKANSDKFANDTTSTITKDFMVEVSKAKVE